MLPKFEPRIKAAVAVVGGGADKPHDRAAEDEVALHLMLPLLDDLPNVDGVALPLLDDLPDVDGVALHLMMLPLPDDLPGVAVSAPPPRPTSKPMRLMLMSVWMV